MICIYVREAHASDQWPIGTDYSCVRQHTTLQERIAAAKLLREKHGLNLPVYIDSMENAFDNVYCAWPERFYVIDTEGDIAFIAHPHDEWGFSRQKIEEAVRRAIDPRTVNAARRLPDTSGVDAFRTTSNLFQWLRINKAVTIDSAKFGLIWRHYDRNLTGYMSQEMALCFLEELAKRLELEYDADRAMVLIESCNSPDGRLERKRFERVFAIWSAETGVSLSDSVGDAALQP